MKKNNSRLYLLLLCGFISNVGDWLSLVALMVVCYQKTSSPLGVSMILVVRAIPTLVFGFYGGHIADRHSKKFIMVVCNLLRAGGIAVLAFNQSIPVVYTVSFIVAGLGAFFTPALDATVPGLVSKNNLVRANAWLSTSQMLAMIVGPALATVCLKWLGVKWTFLIDAFSFAIFGLALLAIPRADAVTTSSETTVIQSLKEGIQTVYFNHKAMMVLTTYLCAYAAMGALGTLELVFCAKVLLVSPQMYGQVIAVAGIGAAIASLWAGKLSLHRMGVLYLAGIILFGGGIALFSLQTALLATIPFLLMEGIGEAFFTIGGKSVLQDLTPDDRLGRVMSLRSISERLGMMIGMFMSGILAELFAVKNILMFTGIGLIALMLILFPLRLVSFSKAKSE